MILDGDHKNPSLRVGWLESRKGLHSFSFSVNALSGHVNSASLSVDKELRDLLDTVSSKGWFIEKIKAARTPQALAKVLQSVVAEQQQHQQPQQQQQQQHLKEEEEEDEDDDDNVDDDDDAATAVAVDFSLVVLKQLDDCGWGCFVSVSEDFSVLTLRAWDSLGREHLFELHVRPDYPYSCPDVRASLPVPIVLSSWPTLSGTGHLSMVLAAVERELKRYARLFAVLSDVDANSWVLEPVQPTFAITSRRIVIERTCSVVVEINPDDPSAMCEMRFLGPPARVQQLQIAMGRNMYLWAPNRSLLQNLEHVLEVTLPSKTLKPGEESFRVECGICYTCSIPCPASLSLRASNSSSSSSTTASSSITTTTMLVPDQACPNPKCARMYHSTCLVEWLQSVPSSRMSFGQVVGNCPYCSEFIAVSTSK